MKFKNFKKQIKIEECNIPDVKEKIKNSSVFQNREYEEANAIPLIRNRNWFRVSLGAAILILIAALAIVFIVPNNKNDDYESSPIHFLNNENELKELVNYYNDPDNVFTKFIDFIDGGFGLAKNASFDSLAYVEIEDPVPTSTFKKSEKEISETNNQVGNVDEADVVKSNGKSIYRCFENYVLINDIDKGNIGETKKLQLASDDYYVNNQVLYLTDDYIIVLFFSYRKFERKEWFSISRYYDQVINVRIYDIESLELKKEYEADFVSFNDSRIVEGDVNVLYLVFNQGIYSNKNNCPHYNEDGNDNIIPINKVCYYDGVQKSNYTYIVSIKLDDSLEVNESVTLGPSYWDGIYVTENSIYMYDVYGEYTIKHDIPGFEKTKWTYMSTIAKYEINNGKITPQASISTEGRIISQFALDEYNGYLRLVSSIVNHNKLEIYKLDSDGENNYHFNLVGSITKGLGEANEEIKSVNFKENECIVVTAKQTDPMYKIDLSDVNNPVILGKFKEDGYNSYLQYLKGDLEGLAIGLGYLTEDISETYNVKKCCKFGLYDVKGDEPIQLDMITYEVYDMEACNNHKAIFVYKNYVGFEERGIYHLYEIVLNENNEYELKEVIKYNYITTPNYYFCAISRMYYVDGYFYLSSINNYETYDSSIVSFNSNYEKLNVVVDEPIFEK